MEKNLELEAYGLKCDNPECDWEDMTIDSSDWGDYIDHNCPKCGDVVYTQEEHDEYLEMKKQIDYINSFSEDEIHQMLLAAGKEAIDRGLDFYNDIKKDAVKGENGEDIFDAKKVFDKLNGRE